MSYSGLETPGRGSGLSVTPGKVALAGGKVPAPSSAVTAAGKRAKSREDTIAGCDALASSDLARAVLADTENGRRKFEQSAASWQQRAGLLRSIQDGLARRTAKGEPKGKRGNASTGYVL